MLKKLIVLENDAGTSCFSASFKSKILYDTMHVVVSLACYGGFWHTSFVPFLEGTINRQLVIRKSCPRSLLYVRAVPGPCLFHRTWCFHVNGCFLLVL